MDNAKAWVAEKKAQAKLLRAIPPGESRIMAFAAFIEQMPMAYPFRDCPMHGFSMHTWGSRDDWTMPASIAGWIDRVWPSDYYVTPPMLLSTLTGKQEGDHSALFFCDGFCVMYSSITPQMAATVIRHFAETGEVDWNIARNQQPEGL